MYQRPSNLIRRILRYSGMLLYRLGFAKKIIALRKNTPRVLLYHAVEDHVSDYTDRLGVSVSSAMFEANLRYIRDHYNVVAPDDLLGNRLPENPLLITFDDGYKSVYDNAFPLLRKYRMPATVYLITCAVNNRLVWVNELNWALLNYPQESLAVCHQFPDLLGMDSPPQIIHEVKNRFVPANIKELCRRIRQVVPIDTEHGLYASRDALQEMRNASITLGFHTRDHFNLANCDIAELQRQLDPEGLEDLINPSTFAYPFGTFDSTAIDALRNCSYQTVMTVGNNNKRYYSCHQDRIEVFSSDPAIVFAQLEIEEPLISIFRKLSLTLRTSSREMRDTHLSGT